jgi:hypothetical protein
VASDKKNKWRDMFGFEKFSMMNSSLIFDIIRCTIDDEMDKTLGAGEDGR